MMDIGEQYGLSDLRHLISQPFPAHRNLPPPHQPHYGLFLVGAAAADQVDEVALSPPPNPIHESPPPPGPPPASLQHQQVGMDFFPGFAEESDGGCPPAAATGVGVGGSGGTSGVGGGGGYSQSHGRWPRQETLTLLEIRSRLDTKFKEAAQKAPLWDEVSRIMAEEHGYHRNGKKCREKLENLYKYYKKTKEGKAGRHDGKHYRFFRQLEALYGENSNIPAADMNNVAEYPAAFQLLAQSSQLETLQAFKHYENLSFSSSSAFDGSSSEGDDDGRKDEAEVARVVGTTGDPDPAGETRHGGVGRVKRGRASWKAKMREFVDLQLKRFMAVQEAWLERMLATLEHKEQERMSREEEWRKQEAARFEQEHKFWAKERAWIEARDAALIEALEKLSGGARGWKAPTPEDMMSMDGAGEDSDNRNHDNDSEALEGTANNRRWPEAEVTCLIQLRTGMEGRFQEGGCPKNALWEEISARMGAVGYERSAKRCKEKWENINKYFRRTKKCHKKRKENSRTCPYYKHLDSLYYSQQGSEVDVDHRGNGAEVAAAAVVGAPADEVVTPSDSNVDAAVAAHEACFPFLFDGEGLWEANAAMGGGGPGQQ
ncbi:hypothetical protein Taro_041598 [Colocasia esculenta]|uniref:Myb-like domain-containing protein n=1 Tax=Colocasia esculenta TaxID=4460 RepID=A0A843WXQ0_COLES|nr:hypothetical protein [Colocasia esculenta]